MATVGEETNQVRSGKRAVLTGEQLISLISDRMELFGMVRVILILFMIATTVHGQGWFEDPAKPDVPGGLVPESNNPAVGDLLFDWDWKPEWKPIESIEIDGTTYDIRNLDRAIVFDRERKKWVHLDGRIYENQGTQQQQTGVQKGARTDRPQPVYYRLGRSRWTWLGDLRQHLQNPPHNLSRDWCMTATPEQLIARHDADHERGVGRSTRRGWRRR